MNYPRDEDPDVNEFVGRLPVERISHAALVRHCNDQKLRFTVVENNDPARSWGVAMTRVVEMSPTAAIALACEILAQYPDFKLRSHSE